MIDLTIVIPSYETRRLLLACLEAVEVARRAHPHLSVETIVVDNGSRDGSVAAVQKDFPDVRIFALARNRGFAAAINTGLAAGQGDAVLLLNSDVEVDRDLLADGLRILDQNPNIGIVGGALFHPDGRRQRTVHPLPGLLTECTPDFVLRKFRPGGYAVTGARRRGAKALGLRHVEAVRGAVFLFRRALIEELGPFNEGFFFFLEETEFCARVRRAGYGIVCTEDAEQMKAVHHLGASSKRRAPLATRIEFHRSLYRYLEVERGWAIANFARGSRLLRGAALILGMSLAYPFSIRVRRQLPERWGLLLWHLRGCPAEPTLAESLKMQHVLESGT